MIRRTAVVLSLVMFGTGCAPLTLPTDECIRIDYAPGEYEIECPEGVTPHPELYR